MLLPCSPLILGSVYPLSCCSFSLSVRLVFYLMIYVSFAVSCSTHGRMKRAEVELKMDDYKSQGNTLNGTMSCRDGMGLCLLPSLIIWLCLWLGEFARKLHGGFFCCAVSNASFKFSSIVYLLCMNMCVWYMCMVHVHVCVRDGVHSHVHAWRPEEGFGCPALLLSALFPGDRASHQTWR